MSEPSYEAVPSPRWIVHSDGRVSEFDHSQLAADLYLTRCLHQRDGAALFAAEISAAVMHFAEREFASPVWRADRLNKLTADLLHELGHGDTSAAWRQRPREPASDEWAPAYSPDLIGLVEERLLDFDLRLEEARPVLKVVDALDFAGAATSADELLAGLGQVLSKAAGRAGRIVLCNAVHGAALLRRPTEQADDIARRLMESSVETIWSSLTPVAIDLRWRGGLDYRQRLGGGPMFPLAVPADWEKFAADVIEELPKRISEIGNRGLALSIWCGSQMKSDRAWLNEWEAGAADVATLVIGEEIGPIQDSLLAEIVVNPPGAARRIPSVEDLSLAEASLRVLIQRRNALLRHGAIDSKEQYISSIGLPPTHESFHQWWWRRLNAHSKAYRLQVKSAPPCRILWGESLAEFADRIPFPATLRLTAWRPRANRAAEVILVSAKQTS